MKKLTVVHVITSLNDGGAEGVLYRLCKYDTDARHIVVSMTDEGKYGPLLKDLKIDVYNLNMSAGKLSFSGVWLLFKLIRRSKPDIVQTWMYHADLIGGLVAKFAGVKNIYWNVRNSTLQLGSSKFSTIVVAHVCTIVSFWLPKKIIYCAYDAQTIHENLGYRKGKGHVIGNGYDLDLFVQNNRYRELICNDFGISTSEVLVGMVGRFDPQKDHTNLITALGVVRDHGVNFKLLLIGRGLDESNTELEKLIGDYRLTDNVHLLGQRTDIPEIMNTLDIHVLASAFGEAFPNVLAEAMACGTPCVTTNVGDAALIVGESGWVVPPNEPQALSKAIMLAIEEKQDNNLSWLDRKRLCRERIIDNFSINNMLKDYHCLWKQI